MITAFVTYLVIRFLWDPVMVLARNFGSSMGEFLRFAFPAGITLPAFAGFLSVSYFGKGCGRLPDSASVMSNPQHLHAVAQNEMASVAEYLIYVLIVWAVIYSILLIIWRRTVSDSNSGPK
jgi:hypothetical protein